MKKKLLLNTLLFFIFAFFAYIAYMVFILYLATDDNSKKEDGYSSKYVPTPEQYSKVEGSYFDIKAS